MRDKSLTELRGIAQSYGIPDIFTKDKVQLIQDIELKQQAMIPEPEIVIPKPEYDARLMDKPPAKRSDQELILSLLAEHTARGLVIEFPEPEQWTMRFGKRTDSGTMRMPPKIMILCADKLMSGKQ